MQDFEGPLTLILMLLSKNKIEIRDIRIADILDQYLAWLEQMQRMDLEVASEFVQMASHLVYIKTKTLLAGTEEVSELELLMSSLEQLKCRDAFAAVKENIPAMGERLAEGALLFSTPTEPMPKYGA
ncbi:MAG: segregation/condensation protein A, partial [Oscillospiraceae bacterium]